MTTATMPYVADPPVAEPHAADRPADDVPPLNNGDRMTQPEFHRAYERMPEHVRAELIGGIVYMASPLRLGHATDHTPLSAVLFTYQSRTPGTQSGDNATVILGPDAEPQPDLFLRILPSHGGLSRTTPDDYLEGQPELVIEVAHASRAIDLHAKRADYARTGVPEYLVYLIPERQLRWFDLAANTERPIDADGVARVVQFPGLWIDSAALAARDFGRLMATLQRGLATPEHAAFVQRLSAAKVGR